VLVRRALCYGSALRSGYYCALSVTVLIMAGCGDGQPGINNNGGNHNVSDALVAGPRGVQGHLTGGAVATSLRQAGVRQLVCAIGNDSGDIAGVCEPDANGDFEIALPDHVQQVILAVLTDLDGDGFLDAVDAIIGFGGAVLLGIPDEDMSVDIGDVDLDEETGDVDECSDSPLDEIDTDGDGTDDWSDSDDDGDGVLDADEEEYLTGTDDDIPFIFDDDWDNDGQDNPVDADDDGDGIGDPDDPCDYGISLPGWLDEDEDGIYDWQDLDDDGDGFCDGEDLDDDGDGQDDWLGLDTDDDGTDDYLDADDDGDGVSDDYDSDADGDGWDDGDYGDDEDGDGYPDWLNGFEEDWTDPGQGQGDEELTAAA